MIKDRDAFRRSLDAIRALPFQRIVVGHGDPIDQDARDVFDAVLAPHGF